MFKIVILLDCDECGISFHKASACSKLGGQPAAKVEARFLVDCAELHGWRFMHEYAICPDCIKADLAMSDYLQEEEFGRN